VAIAIVPWLFLSFFSPFIFDSKINNILPLGTILNSVLESFLNIFGKADKL
jgi:hypothetical protein